MKVGKNHFAKTPVFPNPSNDPPEISQQIISISQINAGVCAKNGKESQSQQKSQQLPLPQS